MTMTIERPTVQAKQHRIDAQGGIHCWRCDKFLDLKVRFLDGATAAPIVIFHKCRDTRCGSYNIVDFQRLIV